jgi:hypothetical protein
MYFVGNLSIKAAVLVRGMTKPHFKQNQGFKIG